MRCEPGETRARNPVSRRNRVSADQAPPRPDDCGQRGLTMGDLTTVESILFAALEKNSAQERAACLDDACGDNADLRRHVERMLAAHPRAATFLTVPAPRLIDVIDEPPIQERPGAVIGPYRLMEQIGE